MVGAMPKNAVFIQPERQMSATARNRQTLQPSCMSVDTVCDQRPIERVRKVNFFDVAAFRLGTAKLCQKNLIT
jgi:hypothetical protein